MKLEPIPKDGTTLTRKAFWDKVAEVVNASQKKRGKNISVDVHDGYGSVINVPSSRSGSGGGVPCDFSLLHTALAMSGTVDLTEGCTGDGCYLDFDCAGNLSNIPVGSDCVPTILTGSQAFLGFNHCFPSGGTCEETSGCGFTWDYAYSGSYFGWSLTVTCTITCGACELTLSASGSGVGDGDISEEHVICGQTVTVAATVLWT